MKEKSFTIVIQVFKIPSAKEYPQSIILRFFIFIDYRLIVNRIYNIFNEKPVSRFVAS